MSSRRIVIRSGGGVLAVDTIPPEADLLAAATAGDLRSVSGFASVSRRAERLAWRALLRETAGIEPHVEYSAAGAPRLADFPDLNISVSHCRDMVAVALARGRCGVDIERVDRNFDRVAPRYLSAAERSLSGDVRLPAAVWCAKECLFKMQGREGLDFLHDITVTAADFAAGTLRGRVAGNPEVAMRLLQPDDVHIVVFSL